MCVYIYVVAYMITIQEHGPSGSSHHARILGGGGCCPICLDELPAAGDGAMEGLGFRVQGSGFRV